MGEAKRRHKLIGQEIEAGVSQDGKPALRYGGRFGEYLADYRRTKSTSPVPCNGCNACCYYNKIDFEPTKERPEDLAHLDMIPDPDREGFVMLRKRDDGGCVHLGPDGQCGVYEHRPLPCRKYDCRIFGVIGLVDTFDGDRRSPAWSFDILSLKERTEAIALQIAAFKYISTHPIWTAAEAVKEAFLGFREALPKAEKLMTAVAKLSPAEREKVFEQAAEYAEGLKRHA